MFIPVKLAIFLFLLGCFLSVEGKPDKQPFTISSKDYMGTSWLTSNNQSLISFDPTMKNVLYSATFIDNIAYKCQSYIYDFRRMSSLLLIYGKISTDQFDLGTVDAFRVSQSGSTLNLASTSMQTATYKEVKQKHFSDYCVISSRLYRSQVNKSFFSGVELYRYELMNSPLGLIMHSPGRSDPIVMINQNTGSAVKVVNFDAPTVNTSTYGNPAFFDGTEVWFTCSNNCGSNNNNNNFVVSSSGKMTDMSIFTFDGANSMAQFYTSRDGNTFFFVRSMNRDGSNVIIKASAQPFYVQEVMATMMNVDFVCMCIDEAGKHLLALVSSRIGSGGKYINVYDIDTFAFVKSINLQNNENGVHKDYTSLYQNSDGIFLISLNPGNHDHYIEKIALPPL